MATMPQSGSACARAPVRLFVQITFYVLIFTRWVVMSAKQASHLYYSYGAATRGARIDKLEPGHAPSNALVRIIIIIIIFSDA